MDADGFAAGLADDVLGFEIDAAGKPARLGSRAEAAAFARDMSEAELRLAAEEVRLSCTEGMLMSLDRDDRIAYTLAEVCEFDGVQAAEVLQIEPAAYRKRLSRARDRLATWMTGKCGIVNPLNACRCARLPKLEKGQTTLL